MLFCGAQVKELTVIILDQIKKNLIYGTIYNNLKIVRSRDSLFLKKLGLSLCLSKCIIYDKKIFVPFYHISDFF